MDKILVFGGTTEGRTLSEWLSGKNTPHTLCVATEYGEQVLSENPLAHVRMGRMNSGQITDFIKEKEIQVVVDATHPFAAAATENIRIAAENAGVKYLRLDRNSTFAGADDREFSGLEVHYFDDTQDCAEALKETEGNILLTTGSKELAKYCEDKDVRDRVVARVLPCHESFELCEKAGVPGKRIIAMQGPFTEEMNLAQIHFYDIKTMVTKKSGKSGGYEEKASVAAKAGIPLYVVGRPANAEGLSFAEVCRELSPYLEKKRRSITLIGCGMGHKKDMTVEAKDALESADIVFGAKRLLADCEVAQESYPYYLAKDILPVLKEKEGDAAVLFSGDSGFYSGAAKMYGALCEMIDAKALDAEVKILPGISSVSNLAALWGISWENAKIFSTHGKGSAEDWGTKLLYLVSTEEKVFTLMSNLADLKAIGELLATSGHDECELYIGYQMSYDEQELLAMKPSDCKKLTKEGLYSMFIINDKAQSPYVTCTAKDDDFLRGKVPMTKEEVRHVSISKLRLKRDSILYDIGSGTGSIAVEAAALSPDIRVFAIEHKAEAVELIRTNAEKFGVGNVSVIETFAPEGLDELPEPTHAFIGGTGGSMKEILAVLFEKNPGLQIVANAVSYETLQEFLRIEDEFDIEDFKLVQVAVTGTREVGRYHMLKSENPIWICSFRGKER